tara:strand:+ start:992 stop:1198 length:207 start_codon:yes stop_codon:yes gene_type:complete
MNNQNYESREDEKSESMQCRSYTEIKGEFVRCEEIGKKCVDPRTGVPFGVHCDVHRDRLLRDSRERSW